MRVSDHYKGSYFSNENFDKKGRLLRIASVEVEKVGKDEKWVMYFKGEDKSLPLNKTNALEIAETLGDDSDDWDGKYIRVYRDMTMFAGSKVPCIRVSVPSEEEVSKDAKDKVPF